MDVSIGPDQQLLVDIAARLAADVATASTAALPPADGAERAWRLLVETGFVGLHLPEAAGGGAGSGVDVALVAEQLARGLSIAPYVGQGVLGPELLRIGGADQALVEAATCGERRVTVALDTALSGVAGGAGPALAFDAAGADVALALDRDGAVVALDLAGSPEVASADLTRVLRRVEVSGSAVAVGAPLPADTRARFDALALAVLSADLVGVMQGALDAAVAYVRDRVQFGVPVGTFQAVQHLAADAKVGLEASRGSMWHAAWAVDELDAAEALLAARQAKAYCSRAARSVTETMVQMLGGIAITWEELAHVRVRRALLDRVCFGDEHAQLDAIAAARLGSAS
jgi:alkylation response protein AidB-like acyl-CoA dehydrogenase